MGVTSPYIVLIILLTPVKLFVLNPNLNTNVCHYYENPNLLALFKDPEEMHTLASRNDFFFDDNQQNRDHIMKNINYDFLDMDKPIRNFRDIADLASDEIGIAKQDLFKPKQIPWKMDEVHSFAGGPEVLPDIMLVPESPVNTYQGPQILTEDEKKLGRFVVHDIPPIREDVIQQEKLLTVEAEYMGGDEINERYLNEPNHFHYPPTVVFNNVVKASENPAPSQYVNDYFKHTIVTPSSSLEEYTIEETPHVEETAHDLQDHLGKYVHHQGNYVPYLPHTHYQEPYQYVNQNEFSMLPLQEPISFKKNRQSVKHISKPKTDYKRQQNNENSLRTLPKSKIVTDVVPQNVKLDGKKNVSKLSQNHNKEILPQIEETVKFEIKQSNISEDLNKKPDTTQTEFSRKDNLEDNNNSLRKLPEGNELIETKEQQQENPQPDLMVSEAPIFKIESSVVPHYELQPPQIVEAEDTGTIDRPTEYTKTLETSATIEPLDIQLVPSSNVSETTTEANVIKKENVIKQSKKRRRKNKKSKSKKDVEDDVKKVKITNRGTQTLSYILDGLLGAM